MKRTYKENIYDKYFSHHTQKLYGEISLSRIEKSFPILSYYFDKHLPNKKDSKIVDLGCGMGDFIYWLTTKGYSNTLGIDISMELITKGRKLKITNLECKDIFSFLKDKANEFDLVIMRDVIEHFDKEETYELISNLYKALTQSGSVIIQTPNGQSPFVGKILFGDFTHYQAFTDSSINQLFSSIGFKNINIYEVGPVPKNLKGRIRLFTWVILKIIFKIGQIIATGDSSGYYSPNIIAIIKK